MKNGEVRYNPGERAAEQENAEAIVERKNRRCSYLADIGAPEEESNQTTITNGTTAASSNNSNSASGAVYVYR